jgi:hypothetical protein
MIRTSSGYKHLGPCDLSVTAAVAEIGDCDSLLICLAGKLSNSQDLFYAK